MLKTTFNRLQVLIDFILLACFNKDMRKIIRQSNFVRGVNLSTNVGEGVNYKKKDFLFFIRRLRNDEQKERREKFIYMMTVVSVLVISGIIVSF